MEALSYFLDLLLVIGYFLWGHGAHIWQRLERISRARLSTYEWGHSGRDRQSTADYNGALGSALTQAFYLSTWWGLSCGAYGILPYLSTLWGHLLAPV